MATIGIQGLNFEIPNRYKAGPCDLTDGEASALQQTFNEAIRNNNSKRIAAMAEEAGGVENLDHAALQAEITEYAEGYNFYVTRQTDPVQSLARRLAMDIVKSHIRKQGADAKKLKDYTAEELQAAAARVIESNPTIVEFARNQVAASRSTLASIKID